MQPNLIHPIPVFIRKLERSLTAIQDDDLHEPLGQARRESKPIKLYAQIQTSDTDAPVVSEGGVVEKTDGYCLFRTADLRLARFEVERGDRIVQIGEAPNAREVDLYITKIRPMGHYPSASGHTLIRAYFEDRKPSRQRGDL